MNITIVGDPHLKKSNIHLMDILVEKIESLQNSVVWLGDMLDTKSVIQSECLNFWIRYFQKSKLQHFIDLGNHDYHNLQCEDHSLLSLKNIPNVRVFDKPESVLYENFNMHFIPFISEDQEFKKAVRKAPEGSVLICHAALDGFDYGTGLVHKGGVALKDLTKFKRVISGHFHYFQQKGNLTYLGTPFSHSFGESDQEKVIGIYETEMDHLELIPTKLPQHRTLNINCEDVESMQQVFEMEKENCQDDIWRIILTGNSVNVNEFTLPDDLRRFKPKIIKRSNELQEQIERVTEAQTPHQQFQQWGSEVVGMSPETLKLGLDILESAR